MLHASGVLVMPFSLVLVLIKIFIYFCCSFSFSKNIDLFLVVKAAQNYFYVASTTLQLTMQLLTIKASIEP